MTWPHTLVSPTLAVEGGVIRTETAASEHCVNCRFVETVNVPGSAFPLLCVIGVPGPRVDRGTRTEGWAGGARTGKGVKPPGAMRRRARYR